MGCVDMRQPVPRVSPRLTRGARAGRRAGILARMLDAPLLPAPLVVTGHLVTFDDARPEIPDGALYVDADGVIVAVAEAADPPPPGFERANRVETEAVVYPGLIDLHNHIAYNC